jgi:hypothetical protein
MACEEKGYWVSANAPKGQGVYGVRRSRGFTGKRGDRHYYRGQEWLGATNAVGHLPNGGVLLQTQDKGSHFGIRPL